MLYSQDTSRCIHPDGLSESAIAAEKARTTEAISGIRTDLADSALPALAIATDNGDLPALKEIADRYREKFTDIVVFGTGGSSLGGKCLHALAMSKGPSLHFIDNVDPASFAKLFARLPYATTGLIVISKSGGTAETLAQLNVFLQWFQNHLSAKDIAERITAIVEPGASALRQIAEAGNFTMLDHDPGIGGRYSVFSLVGALPALIAGLDVPTLRDGAAATLHHTIEMELESHPAEGAALVTAAASQIGSAINVLMLYSDQLFWFGHWYRQLWAESVGKDGHGTTPVPFMGTVDQHSQMQLYLDGPRDKLFTMVMRDCIGTGDTIDAAANGGIDLGPLEGRTLGDLLDASQRGTADALAMAGHPVRLLKIDEVNEATLGALMMHFMLETIITAHLMGVDPFDQPAVERGKVQARQYLREMAD
ncbi:MAG TPA: glucose-6-phosphate isomerase [Rhodospirillaceae bacterium]|nr:glucose-6-phosphate isomerase [Rhodospirillaceae bacterium]